MAAKSKLRSSCHTELLVDVARMAGRSSAKDDLTSELMQAAADPLLLRSVLCRRQLEAPRSVGLRTPDLLVCPGAPGQARHPTSGHRRFAVDPLLTTSGHPERFVPTPDQCDEDDPGMARRSGDLLQKVLVAAAIGFFMVLAFQLLSA